jgi:hypothetical protein
MEITLGVHTASQNRNLGVLQTPKTVPSDPEIQAGDTQIKANLVLR